MFIDKPFKYVQVSYLVAGGATIYWSMRREFTDMTPWTFQLQANLNFNEPDGWVNVGNPVVDTFLTTDPAQRLFGKSNRLAYRIKLTTPVGEYFSDEANTLGILTERQWLIAKAIARRLLQKPKSLRHIEGFLLKRRLLSEPCSCVDPLTGGILYPNHEECFGTGRKAGYWPAVSLKLVNLTPADSSNSIDPKLLRGTIDSKKAHIGMVVGCPFIEYNDIWIDAASDQRYLISNIKNIVEMSRVPILSQLVLQLLPYTDPVYTINVQ